MLYSSESISHPGSDFVFRMNVSYFHSQSERIISYKGQSQQYLSQFIHYGLVVLSIYSSEPKK
jgi:hypothetical protein